MPVVCHIRRILFFQYFTLDIDMRLYCEFCTSDNKPIWILIGLLIHTLNIMQDLGWYSTKGQCNTQCDKCYKTKNVHLQMRLSLHYNDVRMGAIPSQITSLTIVNPTVYLDAGQRKHQSSASLAFVWGIHRWPVNSPHKWPVKRKMFPFDDVIMVNLTSAFFMSWVIYANSNLDASLS